MSDVLSGIQSLSRYLHVFGYKAASCFFFSEFSELYVFCVVPRVLGKDIPSHHYHRSLLAISECISFQKMERDSL